MNHCPLSGSVRGRERGGVGEDSRARDWGQCHSSLSFLETGVQSDGAQTPFWFADKTLGVDLGDVGRLPFVSSGRARPPGASVAASL